MACRGADDGQLLSSILECPHLCHEYDDNGEDKDCLSLLIANSDKAKLCLFVA